MPTNRDLFGQTISPAQHVYLKNSDPAAAEKLLLKVSLQNLSQYPGEAPSEYFDITLREGSTLDLVFEYAQVPRGSFLWAPTFEHYSRNSVLHLNTANNDYYQNGIPQVADSIEAAADWIRNVRSALKKPTLRAIGSSMGAYAALLFGNLAKADFIFAFSPNIRGTVRFLGKEIPYRAIGDVLPRIADRSLITFGAFELVDYEPISHCLQAGLRLNDISLLGNVHGNSSSIRLDQIIIADGAVMAQDVLINPYNTPLDTKLINNLATAYRLIGTKQHADALNILQAAAKVDTLNPEFQYRLAVHMYLAGRPDEALAAAHEAIRLMQYHNTVAGSDILGASTDFRRKVIHDYSSLLGFTELKAISGLFDRIPKALVRTDLPA